MGCCGNIPKKARQIAIGYINLAKGKKYEFTDDRVRICQKCEFNYWIGRTLWCSICGCFIPPKARVKDAICDKGFWNKE